MSSKIRNYIMIAPLFNLLIGLFFIVTGIKICGTFKEYISRPINIFYMCWIVVSTILIAFI